MKITFNWKQYKKDLKIVFITLLGFCMGFGFYILLSKLFDPVVACISFVITLFIGATSTYIKIDRHGKDTY